MRNPHIVSQGYTSPCIIIPVVVRGCEENWQQTVHTFPGGTYRDISAQTTETPHKHTQHESQFKCLKCGKYLSTQKILEYHIKEVHSEHSYPCQQQGCEYRATSLLRLHRHSCRPPTPACGICGSRTVDKNKHFYNVHKVISCKICRLDCMGYNGLKKHQGDEHSKPTQIPELRSHKGLKKSIIKTKSTRPRD